MRSDGSKASGGHGLLHHAGGLNADRGAAAARNGDQGMVAMDALRTKARKENPLPHGGKFQSRVVRRAKRLAAPKDRLGE